MANQSKSTRVGSRLNKKPSCCVAWIADRTASQQTILVA